MEKSLPPIPPKRYFTIGEVSDLCQVKPYVLRYWEQEFTQLKPMKRRGNRRYYQHHEVLLVRRIRDLLYDQGFTISGARNRLAEAAGSRAGFAVSAGTASDIGVEGAAGGHEATPALATDLGAAGAVLAPPPDAGEADPPALPLDTPSLRRELESIRSLLASGA
jgi:DNA-binding transcriptional MerR regulator